MSYNYNYTFTLLVAEKYYWGLTKLSTTTAEVNVESIVFTDIGDESTRLLWYAEGLEFPPSSPSLSNS